MPDNSLDPSPLDPGPAAPNRARPVSVGLVALAAAFSLVAALAAGATLWRVDGEPLATRGVGSFQEARAAKDRGSRAGLAAAGQEPKGPIVIELFTSQGCSSCPPADRLLSELAQREGIVALAYHVDYWNRLGWTDPFSHAAYSARQRRYARALPSTVYTPQLVVDGEAHVVGSKPGAVESAIRRAQAIPKPLSFEASSVVEAGFLEVDAIVRRRGEEPAPAASLLAVVVEDGRVTEVERGENARKTLRDDRIVRHLEALGPVRVDQPVQWRFPVDPTWNLEHTAVVLLAQAEEGLRILGARSMSVGDRASARPAPRP